MRDCESTLAGLRMTYPFLHSWLVSSSVLIMLIIISSLTRPPASMIFLASRPSAVFAATCARSMSPVACTCQYGYAPVCNRASPSVPELDSTYQVACAELVLDARRLCTLACRQINEAPMLRAPSSQKRTSAGRPDQDHPDALLCCVCNADLALQPGLELRNTLLEPGNGALEVRDR